jgi:hypothetical protein
MQKRDFEMFLHGILEDTMRKKEAFAQALGEDVPTMLKRVQYVLANLADDSYVSREDAETAKQTIEMLKNAWGKYVALQKQVQKQNVRTVQQGEKLEAKGANIAWKVPRR